MSRIFVTLGSSYHYPLFQILSCYCKADKCLNFTSPKMLQKKEVARHISWDLAQGDTLKETEIKLRIKIIGTKMNHSQSNTSVVGTYRIFETRAEMRYDREKVLLMLLIPRRKPLPHCCNYFESRARFCLCVYQFILC